MDLPPDAIGAIAAFFLVLLVVLDVYASLDDTPGNTPRQIIVHWAGWGRTLMGIPLTGAPIPFCLGVLLGHWFHPGDFPDLVGGMKGLLVLLTVAVALSLVFGILASRGPETGQGRSFEWGSSRWSGRLAAFGIVAGALIWPVSA